jgi:hypothetical protein
VERKQTRLQNFIDELGLKAKEITDEAYRISMAEGVESISRQHFLRLRQGRASATAERIYIIVAAVQSLTGMMVRATDLFLLQPATPGPASLPWEGVVHTSSGARLDLMRNPKCDRSPVAPPSKYFIEFTPPTGVAFLGWLESTCAHSIPEAYALRPALAPGETQIMDVLDVAGEI